MRRIRTADRISAGIVGLEALGVFIVSGWMVVAFVGGDVAEPATAIALLVTTLIGAAALAGFAVAIARDTSWGRSGGIVAQLLILAVALGAVTGSFAHPLIALVLAVPALGGLVALIVATRDAGRARARDEDQSSHD